MYAIVVIYQVEKSGLHSLGEIDREKLQEDQVIHLAKEMIEILLNMNSQSLNCYFLNKDCFLMVKNKDVKIDLFYLAITQEFEISLQQDQKSEDTYLDQSLNNKQIVTQQSVSQKQYWFAGSKRYIANEVYYQNKISSDKSRIYSLGVILNELNEFASCIEIYEMIENEMLVEESMRFETLDLIESQIYIDNIEKSFDEVQDLPYQQRDGVIKIIYGDQSSIKINENLYENQEIEELFSSLDQYNNTPRTQSNIWSTLENIMLNCSNQEEEYAKSTIQFYIQTMIAQHLSINIENTYDIDINKMQIYYESTQDNNCLVKHIDSLDYMFLLELLNNRYSTLTNKLLMLQLITISVRDQLSFRNFKLCVQNDFLKELFLKFTKIKVLILQYLRLLQELLRYLNIFEIIQDLAFLFYKFNQKEHIDLQIEILITLQQVQSQHSNWINDFLESGFVGICKNCLKCKNSSPVRSKSPRHSDKSLQELNQLASISLYDYAINSGDLSQIDFIKQNALSNEIVEIISTDLRISQI